MLFKIQEAADVLAAKGEVAALRFASKLNCLGGERDAIQRAASALGNPQFYRDLGQNPDELFLKGVAALRRLIEANEKVLP